MNAGTLSPGETEICRAWNLLIAQTSSFDLIGKKEDS